MATKPKKKNPRLASGRKRVRQDTKLNAANTSLRSKYRTAVKNVEKAVLAGDKTKAAELFGKMQARATRAACPPRSRPWPPPPLKFQRRPRACSGRPTARTGTSLMPRSAV